MPRGVPTGVRRTPALRKIAVVLMDNPADVRHYGWDLGKAADVRSASVYRILRRLLDAGWVTDGWEDEQITRAERRPPRRYYQTTPAGRRAMADLLEMVDPGRVA